MIQNVHSIGKGGELFNEIRADRITKYFNPDKWRHIGEASGVALLVSTF